MLYINKLYALEVPKILYKYRDWCNKLHKQVITEGKLYLASPKEFEDIFDCNIPEKFPEGKRELNNLFLNIAKNEHPQWSRQEKRKYARYWEKKSPLANPKQRDALCKEFRQKDCDTFGVLSMTEACNNEKMWQKYANEHKGFCIGISTVFFENYALRGGPIEYFEELPSIDFEKDSLDEIITKNFYKEAKWSFEKEYRIAKRWNHKVTTDERIIKIPDDCIIEIILGKNMPNQDKEEIKGIVRNKYPHATVIENV